MGGVRGRLMGGLERVGGLEGEGGKGEGAV